MTIGELVVVFSARIEQQSRAQLLDCMRAILDELDLRETGRIPANEARLTARAEAMTDVMHALSELRAFRETRDFARFNQAEEALERVEVTLANDPG